MKNLFLVLFVLCSSHFVAKAQFAVKGGVNLSYISGEKDVILERESRVAFQFGVVYKHLIADEQFAIQPEIKFIRKTSNFSIEGYRVNGQLNYLEVPVMGVFNFLDGALCFQLGPQFGFLTGVKYNFKKEGSSGESFQIKERSRFNSYDIGLGFGAQVNLDHVYLELRHNIGMLDVDKDVRVDGVPVELNVHNFNAEFSVGYFF